MSLKLPISVPKIPNPIGDLPNPVPDILNSLSEPADNGAEVFKDGDLTKRWKEILGNEEWKELLDPFDPLLRLELIKYGELAVANTDAFIGDIYSTRYGQCKYEKEHFFEDPVMPQIGYNVTDFLFASSNNNWWPWNIERPKNPDWKPTDVWMGFVAVSDDETTKKLGRRDICVSWRGTLTGTEWAEDLSFMPVPVTSVGIPCPDPAVQVHSGFLSLYSQAGEEKASARTGALAELKRLINEVYPKEEVSITVTGHSLGAALAVLHAYDIVESKANVRADGTAVHVSAMTMAGPRVGTLEFKARVDEQLKLKVLRVVSLHDAVPKLPPPGVLMRYTHVGVELEVNSDVSPHLKTVLEAGIAAAHDLEGYMHLLDGYHGPFKKFESAAKRDIALVNKNSGFLKESYNIPVEWRVDLNKGMVKKDGRWVHT